MNDYDKGLEKLGLPRTLHPQIEHPYYPDLRLNPAFAWRVLEEFYARGLFFDLHGTIRESLYAAVCELGRQP